MRSEFFCGKCFEEMIMEVQDTNRRLVVGLNEDGFCDCLHYDDPIMEKLVGWTCDRCKLENICPQTMHEILYIDNKLPFEIQAELKYGLHSEAYHIAKDNFATYLSTMEMKLDQIF
ncbi:MAG: hypothetical protein WD512_12440 [Candidatus Paceibacterota bacterium]